MIYREDKREIPEKLNLIPGDLLKLHSGEYQILSSLGEGGFGNVYHVRHGEDSYALKVLSLWNLRSEKDRREITDRFLREYQSGLIPSEYIVRTYNQGSVEGNPYIIMEYCPGGSLLDMLSELQNESIYEAIAKRVLYGLADLHHEGIIHRDLKPANILIDRNKKVLLTDFGIAGYINNRMTQTDRRGFVKQLWGTVVYTPPEQLNHATAFTMLGPVTDMFAFGVMSYEILTNGEFPFGDAEEFAKNRKEFYQRVKMGHWYDIRKHRPDLSDRWVEIIRSCLHPNPKERLQNPAAVLEKLGAEAPKVPSKNNAGLKPRDNREPKLGAPPKRVWYLKVMTGEAVGEVYNLNNLLGGKNSGFLTLGRSNAQIDSGNDIAIIDEHNRYISTRHATLEFLNGRWYIRDGQWIQKAGKSGWIRSTNGTALNYEFIESAKSTVLSSGDIISVGETTLKVEVKNNPF